MLEVVKVWRGGGPPPVDDVLDVVLDERFERVVVVVVLVPLVVPDVLDEVIPDDEIVRVVDGLDL